MCCGAMAVNLNEFQIRYPEFPKFLWSSNTPYSDAMNIKKSRRNPDHTKRPLNTFMLFAKIQREYITSNFSCNHSEISKALGKLWQDLSKEEKDPFICGAKTLVELHRLEYPDYKYRPRKKGQAKEVAPKSIVAKKSASRQKMTKQSSDELLLDSIKKERVYMTGMLPQQSYLAPDSPPYHEQMYPSGGSPTVGPASPLSSCVGRLSPASGLGLASPASHLHTPYSPVPSICSSSGYESEMSSCLTAHELSAALDEPRYDCWSPQSEPDMTLDLRDLEVTPLDEATLLNPLAMFPVLDLSSDDLDDLQIGL